MRERPGQQGSLLHAAAEMAVGTQASVTRVMGFYSLKWHPIFFATFYLLRGLPWGLSVIKASTCQCRRLEFNPWVGKTPWRRKWHPLQCTSLGKPMDREAWWATVHVVEKESCDLATKQQLIKNKIQRFSLSSMNGSTQENTSKWGLLKDIS